jgi:hypothetical protein
MLSAGEDQFMFGPYLAYTYTDFRIFHSLDREEYLLLVEVMDAFAGALWKR